MDRAFRVAVNSHWRPRLVHFEMDREMDRDGSARSVFLRIRTGAHDLWIFTDGSADGS